jgi:hypothetical protein
LKHASIVVRCCVIGALAGAFVAAMRAPVGESWLAPAVLDFERDWILRMIGALGASLLVLRAKKRLGARFEFVATALGFAGVVFGVQTIADGAWGVHNAVVGVVFVLLAGAFTHFLLRDEDTATAKLVDTPATFDLACAAFAAFAVLRMRVASAEARWLADAPIDSPDVRLAVAVALACIGACAAAPFAARGGAAQRWALAAWLAVAASTFEAARVLSLLGDRDALERFVSSAPWKLGLDVLGTSLGDALIGARVLLFPALACGVALVLTNRASVRGWVLFGLAIGTCVPLSTSGRTPSEIRGTKGVLVRAISTRWGWIEIEDEDGSRVVRVDGRLWTPKTADFELERALLEPLRGARHVLVIGVVSPEREILLRELGVERIVCTAPFEDALAELLDVLRAGSPAAESIVTTLAQSEADSMAQLGDFDAVWMPPIEGARVRCVPPELSSKVLAWYDSSAAIAEDEGSEHVEVHVDHLERLFIGLGSGGELANGPRPAHSLATNFAMSGSSAARANTLKCAQRLAAAKSGERDAVLDALARHFSAQVASSPFETRSQTIELERGAMDVWLAHLQTRGLRSFERSLVEAWANVLTDKRELELLESHIEPLARAHEAWPELELALARADVEMLDPTSAARRLETVLAMRPKWSEAALLRARCLLAIDRPAQAVETLEQALVHTPTHFELRRELAVALVRANDSRGHAAVLELLREAPEDDILRAHAGPGPYPPLTPKTR